MRFDRCRALFGEDFIHLESAHILLLGAGGVGSFCLDCLYRSGVRAITVVDFDCYDITNLNRQIGANEASIGKPKVEVLANLYPGIVAINKKIDPAWVESFDFAPYDLVLDAIDDLPAKVALAKKVSHKLIMATGSARKADPTRIEADSIWKTWGDHFAKRIREALKKEGFSGDFLAIFSPEPPRISTKGSFVGVTGSFGLALCAKAIERLIASNNHNL